MQQLQHHQKQVEEVIAEEGGRVGDGLVVCGIEDPEAGGWVGRQEGEVGFTSSSSPQS